MNQKQNLVSQVEQFSKGTPENIVKELYFIMTCIATFTCIIRSDYNFAFGLLGYYMIKTANPKKISRTASTMMLITVTLIVMDILWVITMRNVWNSKPWDNHTRWAVFDYLRTVTLLASYISIIIKVSEKLFHNILCRLSYVSNSCHS